jgi:hypothetical protein
MKTFVSAVLAGISIGLGGLVFLAVDNRVAGAALFTIGLFVVCTFGLHLFTGKVCYALENDRAFALALPVIWLGNLCGTGLTAGCARLTRAAGLAEKAAAIRGHVIILSLSCFSGTLMEYCGQLDPDRCTIWMSCGREDYTIGSTEKLLYHACTAVQDDESGAIELGEISAFQLKADDAAPCVYGNPANFVFPVK